MLIRALVDEFPVEYKYMSPDASEEAAVAGLLCLNSDEKHHMKKPAKNQSKAQAACKPGKRSAPEGDGCDSATQTDSVTLSDGADESREREVDSACGNGTTNDPKHRKRQKTGAKAPSKNVGCSPGQAGAAGAGSEGGNKSPSSAVPFTLASAAQAAGVWNRSAAKPMLPTMPTMASATETSPHSRRPSNTGLIAPFEGCDEGAVVKDTSKDSVEHADALHRESGADPISHEQQNSIAAQQHADLAAILSENSTRTIPSETLQKLIQQVGSGGQLSIQDLVRVCQQSSQPANGTSAVDDGTNVTHTSTVSTMDVFPALSSDTRTQAHTRLRRQSSQPDGAAACDASVPVSAHARSLFVQLSDAAGTDAQKAQLERTATPVVHRAAGQPPHMPLGVGQTEHRTRSISGAPRPLKPSAQSLTPPLPAYRQTIGHAVPVTSHQTHKSDLLNNPEARTSLWFPEKTRNAKSKSKFPAAQKRAADNKQMGLALDRLQPDSSAKSSGSTPTAGAPAAGAKNLVAMAHCLNADGKTEQAQSEQLRSTSVPASMHKAQLEKAPPITPERVHGLLSLVSQLAVFADGGVSGAWCRSLQNADCARARSLFRRALELQMKGTTPSHLAPLLTTQANTAAAFAAFAAASTSTHAAARTLRTATSIPVGLQAAAANAAAATVEAAHAAAASNAAATPSASVSAGTAGGAASTPVAKRTPKRRSSVAASTR